MIGKGNRPRHTDLPAIAAFIAQDKSSHGLISTSCLHLVIGTVLFLAFAALEEVSGSAAGLGHLVLTNSLLSHGVPQFPQLITGHFLERNKSALQG